ncbi:hypothetical protein UFOVP20_48 [uncultured Caudovirales phage]|uniref:Uncharacterized protein n=1 Tax=uncultured Caudovirales phage TaxID=2100421 RepID=A0A6J5KIW1_9CAUD|nr:hypothetical protein UFOVP20_48 [uncultured Caudovirales phage]
MDGNPYTSAYAPQTMGQQVITAPMQNMQNQQANMNQLMQQQNQMVQQAGQQPQGGSTPMALAQALRGMKQNGQQAQNPVSGWENASAWMNSNVGRDQMQPNSPEVQNMVDQYYGPGISNIWSA